MVTDAINLDTLRDALDKGRDKLIELHERVFQLSTPWLDKVGLTDPVQQQMALSAFYIALAVFFILGFMGFTRRRRGLDDEASLSELNRRPRRIGILAIAVLLSVFGGWSALAPLASAALAPGVVSPDGNRKTIQHLEGGIIRSIHVRDGDHVAVGQPLVTLDDTNTRARLEELTERFNFLAVTEARLIAERNGSDQISFPAHVGNKDDPRIQELMEGQQSLLASRQAMQSGREEILKARIRQLDEQNAGLRDVIAAQERQRALIISEVETTQKLVDQGLQRLPHLLALERGQADIEAGQAANRARIAENEQQIGETRLQILATKEQSAERINDEIVNVQQKMAEVRSQLPTHLDRLSRTVIRAPIDGTVMNVAVHTESGVLGSGAALLDIVPDEARLIVDARVRPTDIDRVHPGMKARVLLSAYRQRNMPLIHGDLISISPDSLADQRTGDAYFLAKVSVAPEELEGLVDVKMSPGMPAEVMLLDDEKTMLGYLFDPLKNSLLHSFREN